MPSRWSDSVGKTLGEDIAIEYMDLLPGEKEHENLHSANERLLNTSHPKIKRVESKPLSASQWEQLQMRLLGLDLSDDTSVLNFLKEISLISSLNKLS